jgi:hypothetical protein
MTQTLTGHHCVTPDQQPCVVIHNAINIVMTFLHMTRQQINISITFLFFLSFASCKHETEPPVDLHNDYFPTNIGHWVTYEVDSTYYDDFNNSIEIYHYYIKELNESSFLDNQNRPTIRLERYKNVDSIWHLSRVWTSNLTKTTAEKIEENIRFIKLIFPISDEQEWNGNAFNSLGEQNYKYTNIFQPFTVNGITFDSTVTVIQAKDSSGLTVNNQIEVFAKNVGLIYKYYKSVGLDFPVFPTLIDSGKIYTYKIINYGN